MSCISLYITNYLIPKQTDPASVNLEKSSIHFNKQEKAFRKQQQAHKKERQERTRAFLSASFTNPWSGTFSFRLMPDGARV
jgi:ribosomal protein L9